MKRNLLPLLGVFVALAAVSCGSEGGTAPVSTEDPSSEPASEPEAVSSEIVYDIPEPELPELDYGGADFTVYISATGLGQDSELFKPQAFLSSEGLIGEIVNDAVFNRNLKVEEKFNIKFNIIDNETAVETLITAGEPFDLAMADSTLIADAVYTGAFRNMIDFPYLSLESEYWNEAFVRDITIDHALFMMPCDICLDPLAVIGFLYFNKRLLGEYDLESPYDMVKNDAWTLENYVGLIRQVHSDLNGDGVMDMSDLYGALHIAQWRMGAFFQFYFGAGQSYTKPDPEEGRVLNFNAEIGQGIIDMTHDIFEDTTICLDNVKIADITGTSHWTTPEYPLMFVQGHCLFIQDEITAMDYFREMEDDFGIVPNPKYDETQDRYYQRVRPYFGAFCLPATIQDDEKTGAITEYWAWLSHYTILPAYYEITIKQKRVRDEETLEMLEIITHSQVFEFGDVYYSEIPHYMWDAYYFKSFARKITASEKYLAKKIRNLIKIVRKAAENG